ncbi:MAG: serine/threonine-protein kinase [Bryobacteraceae bacterium]|jgi:serine/threonine-protein kinase
MDRKIDPSTVETTLEPAPQKPTSSSTMGISHISSAPTADEGRFVPGTLLGGRYRVIGLLGRGGMGEVYRATDLMLGQSVALKFLPPEASSNPRLLERFHGEVRVARQVSHPNVCRVYDIGEIQGMPFLSMEYVDGEDLAGLLQRIGRLPEDKALVTARQLCAGLQAAHDRGVIHRDLKPQNIMMNKRGEVVIMDFGLAAIADQLTGAEVHNGTPAYMAPEQLKGAEVTARSDIYALGLVLYEIFTGRRPFEGQSVKQLLEQQESAHLPGMTGGTVEVDPAVEKTIRRCLEPDPAKRPGSALSVAAALPGGDALAAALAAGETPSPELVAASGEQEGLERKISVPCLVLVMACVVAAIVLQGRQVALMNAPLDDPPEVLAHKAREMARAFGYPRKPADTNFTLENRDGLRDHLKKLPGPPKWREWFEAESPIRLDYRESQSSLVASPYGLVSGDNPPPVEPGMVRAVVDGAGRLREFHAVPYAGGADLAKAVEPAAVFLAAGLDMAAFSETPAKFLPAAAADQMHAWKGPHPKIPNLDLTVDMATWKGRVTEAKVEYDWKQAGGPAAGQSQAAQVRGIIFLALRGLAVLAAVLLARRNWKLGRTDRKGALRIATAVFFLGMIGWLGTVHAVPSDSMFGLFFASAATWLVSGIAIWLLYLALEPSVRARWPHSLVTWNRLLAGRWLDAQVGAHILIGAAVGSAVWTAASVVDELTGNTMGGAGGLAATLGTRQWIAFHASDFSGVLFIGLLFFFALTGLRHLVKKDAVAAVLAALFFTLVNGNPLDSPDWKVKCAIYFGMFAVLIFVLLRYGLVAIMAAACFINSLDSITLGGDWKTWYAPAGLATVTMLLGIALFAFWRSLGSRELIGGKVAEA